MAAVAPAAAVPLRGSLNLRTAFGMNFSLRSNAAWLDTDNLVYVAGGFLVRLNVTTRAQSFSVLDDVDGAPASGGGPTAIAVSPSKRYLAVAMTTKSSSFISIFSTRTMARRKTLPISLGESAPGMSLLGGYITALAFSADDSWVAAVGCAPSWSLGVFSVDRGRLCALTECSQDAPLAGALPLLDGDKGDGVVGAELPLEVNGVEFSPTATDRIFVWGNAGYARFFTVVEQAPPPSVDAAAAAAAPAAPAASPAETAIDGSATPAPQAAAAVSAPAAPSAADAAAKRKSDKAAEEAAAAAAALAAVTLSHALLALPSSPLFLAYIEALRSIHHDQATDRNAASAAGRRMRRGVGGRDGNASVRGVKSGESISSMATTALEDPEMAPRTAASAEASALSEQQPADDAAIAAQVGIVNDENDLADAADGSDTESVAPFQDSDAAPRSGKSALSPADAAIIASAVAAVRASSTPALSWLSFTSAAWVAPSGPVNVGSGDTTPWTPDASASVLVVGTAAGDILAFKDGVLLASLPTAPRDGRAILKIAPFSRGFLAGSVGGTLRLFDLLDPAIYAAEQEDKELAEAEAGAPRSAESSTRSPRSVSRGSKPPRRMSARTRVMRSRQGSSRMGSASSARSTAFSVVSAEEMSISIVDESARKVLGALPLGAFFVATRVLSVEESITAASPEPAVTHVAIRPGDKSALVIVAGTQCLNLDLANIAVTEGNRALSDFGVLSCHAAPSGVFCGAGSALDTCAIVAMDVASQKPLIATAGVDKVVRIWNWVQRSCLVARAFDESPVSVAMAPSGFQVVVSFPNSFVLFSVLAGGLRKLARYQTRSVTRIKFSRGGAFFAVSAGTLISVYSALTGASLYTLRGHTAPVTSLLWAYNDATLISTGLEGAIYEWDVREGKRAREYLQRGLRIFSASSSKDGRSIYLVGDFTTQPGAGSSGTAPDGALASATPDVSDFSSADGSQGSSSRAAVSVTLAVLREIDLDKGVVMREWVFDGGITHAGIVLSTQLSPPMLFSCEGGLPGVPTLTGRSIVASTSGVPPPPLRAGGGLSDIRNASIASAASKAWLAASTPGGGAVWSYEMPLEAAPYPGVRAAMNAAMAAAVGKGQPWSPESGLPLPIPFDPPAAARFSCAGTAAHSLILSSDEMVLFAAGMNGTILVYDVKDAEGQAPVSDTPSKIPLGNEMLLTRSELSARQKSLKFMREQLGQVQANAEYKSITRENAHQDELNNMKLDFDSKLKSTRQERDQIDEETKDLEKDAVTIAADDGADHSAEFARREAFYQTCLMEEVDRYTTLTKEVELIKQEAAVNRARTQERFALEISRAESSGAALRQAADAEIADIEAQIAAFLQEAAEITEQTLEDADAEVHSLAVPYTAAIKAERDRSNRFKSEILVLKKRIQNASTVMDSNKADIRRRLTRQSKNDAQIAELERDISALKSVIREKDAVIVEKDKMLGDLKTNKMELEKFRFVLDSKIKELKREIEPREVELGALKSQIGAVNEELGIYDAANTKRDATIGEMREDLDSHKESLITDRISLRKGEKRLDVFERALYSEVQEAGKSGDWLSAAVRLAETFGPSNDRPVPETQVDLGFITESLKQQVFLSKTLTKMRSESARASTGVTSDVGVKGDDMVAENAALISQIASLDATIAAMRSETKQLNLRVAQRGGASESAATKAGTGHRAVAATRRESALE